MTWDYEISGDVALTPAGIGALDMAKQNIINTYFAKVKVPPVADISKPEYNKNERGPGVPGELRVNKTDALNTYIDHRSKIEKRITLIARSDDTQQFIINRQLLDNV